MKILLSILLSFSYLLLSLNITFNVHYCSDEFESVSFFAGSDTCCCSSMEIVFCDIKGNCCENIHYSFLFDTDEQIVQSISVPFRSFHHIEIKEIIKNSPVLSQSKKLKHSFYDLPPPPKKAIYKQTCSLIFYG